MKHFKITIQYDGTRYKGWQVQKNTKDTIQGKIEDVLFKMANAIVEVRGAGRTDAGVHAYEQVADFFLEDTFEKEDVLEYLNQYLPEDIYVTSINETEERFHSRLSAKQKMYRYRICKGKKADVFQRKYVECMDHNLDVASMRQAALYAVGTHDFMAFCGNRKMKKSTIRTIASINIEETGSEIRIDITGDGFLQNMVRILVGTLVEIGLGKRKSEEMSFILESKNRDNAGYTISSKGLAMVKVFYDEK